MAETLRRDAGRAFSRHTSYLPSRKDIGLRRTCQQVVELTPDSVVTWHWVRLLYNGFNPSDVTERSAYSCCAEQRKRLERSQSWTRPQTIAGTQAECEGSIRRACDLLASWFGKWSRGLEHRAADLSSIRDGAAEQRRPDYERYVTLENAVDHISHADSPLSCWPFIRAFTIL
jgi:hypothetical protein